MSPVLLNLYTCWLMVTFFEQGLRTFGANPRLWVGCNLKINCESARVVCGWSPEMDSIQLIGILLGNSWCVQTSLRVTVATLPWWWRWPCFEISLIAEGTTLYSSYASHARDTKKAFNNKMSTYGSKRTASTICVVSDSIWKFSWHATFKIKAIMKVSRALGCFRYEVAFIHRTHILSI